MNEPEKCTSSEAASKEGQEGEDENGGPDGNTATEVLAVAHRVVVENSLDCRGERQKFVRCECPRVPGDEGTERGGGEGRGGR